MKINIQSISDIITNSSTEVFTIYTSKDLETIKDIVNAILAINGSTTFDDLFNIGLMPDEYKIEELYDENTDIQEKYPTLADFDNFINGASDEELQEIAEIWQDNHYDYYGNTFFSGYWVTLKEGIELTPKLEQAMRAIGTFDNIFEHDASYC